MATKIIGLGDVLGALAGAADASDLPKPATREEAIPFITADKLKIGDIVTWRDAASKDKRWPAVGEKVVVSDVYDQPFRGGEDGSNRSDVSLLYVHRCGAPGCEQEGQLIEFGFDSRRLTRVGSILD